MQVDHPAAVLYVQEMCVYGSVVVYIQSCMFSSLPWFCKVGEGVSGETFASTRNFCFQRHCGCAASKFADTVRWLEHQATNVQLFKAVRYRLLKNASFFRTLIHVLGYSVCGGFRIRVKFDMNKVFGVFIQKSPITKVYSLPILLFIEHL